MSGWLMIVLPTAITALLVAGLEALFDVMLNAGPLDAEDFE